MLALVAYNPAIVIHILKALSHGIDAYRAWRDGRRIRAGLCLGRAILHGLLGVCHLAHAA